MSFRHLAALLLGSTLIVGTASAQTVLKVVPEADLRVLDPVAVTVNLTRIHGVQIFESLFAWNDRFEPQPMMIESYSKAPDGLSYSFTLRPDLKFHDGSTVTTKDVVASLNRWMKRDAIGQTVGVVRAFGGQFSSQNQITYLYDYMSQGILTPPSVFNWFSPLYKVPNSTTFGPEFQIYSATDATLRGNFMYTLISGLANHPTFAPYGNDMAGAVEVANQMFLYGRMPAAMKQAIITAATPGYDAQARITTVIYLTVLSGFYAVQY